MTVNVFDPESIDRTPVIQKFADPAHHQDQWKPKYCDSCRLCDETRVTDLRQPLGGALDLMVLVDKPILEDTESTEPFTARTWNVFKRLLHKHLDGRGVTWQPHYALMCADSNAKISDFRHCSAFLHTKIRMYKPKVILAFGLNAVKSLGYADTNMDCRGEVRQLELPGTEHKPWVIITYDKEVYFNYRNKMRFLKILELDVKKALHILNNGFEPFKKETLLEKTKLIDDEEEAVKLLKSITDKPNLTVAWDTETARPGLAREVWLQHFDPRFEITILSLCAHGVGWAIDLRKMGDPVWEAIRAFLSGSTKKVAYNAQFDIKAVRAYKGICVENTLCDPMYDGYLLDENRGGDQFVRLPGEYGLKKQQWDHPALWPYAGYEGDLVKKIFKGKAVFEEEHWEMFMRYAAMDAFVTQKLIDVHERELNHRTQKEMDVYTQRKLEIPKTTKLYDLSRGFIVQTLEAVTNMELRGWAIDQARLAEFERAAEDIYQDRTESLRKLIHPDFTITKPAMLARYLFTTKGLTPPKLTATGGASTDEEALKALAGVCPEVTMALDLRKVKKMKDFLNSVRDNMSSDGRVHPSYQIEGTKTGRLSCRRPNVQQLTSKIGLGAFDKVTGKYETEFNLKKMYTASDGMTLLGADYSQMEIVILACYVSQYSKEENKLIGAIEKGYDIHSFNAAQMFDHEYDEVFDGKEDPDHPRHSYFKGLRSAAKAVTFGIIYGSGARGMAEKNGVDEPTALKWINKMFDLYPGIKAYIEASHRMAKKYGYVDTFFGRRRRLPVYNYIHWSHSASNRIAQNTRIQSSASDVNLQAVILLDQHLSSEGGAILGTVHDSIFAEVPDDAIDAGCEIYRKCMVDIPTEMFGSWLVAPLKIDIEVGPSWGELEKIE